MALLWNTLVWLFIMEGFGKPPAGPEEGEFYSLYGLWCDEV